MLHLAHDIRFGIVTIHEDRTEAGPKRLIAIEKRETFGACKSSEELVGGIWERLASSNFSDRLLKRVFLGE